MTCMNIADEIRKGNKRAAARLITKIENEESDAAELLEACLDFSVGSRIIGITGPPGAGKSTLTDQLTKYLIKQGKQIGIIAVDPSSPISGGAFLGDRVRMSDLNREPGVFIRSMGTRGAFGGISKATQGAVRVMQALGMDYIFVETVGVGQSEVDVAGIADAVVLVTIPGSGDDIQAEKAGILEIVDVIAINKADMDGAERTARYLSAIVDTEIIPVIALTGQGIPELMAAADRRCDCGNEFGKAENKRFL